MAIHSFKDMGSKDSVSKGHAAASESWLEQQLLGLPKPDVVVHLGAGAGGELDFWKRCGGQRIVLVEGNPDDLPALYERSEGLAYVELIPSVLADRDGRCDLTLFNDPAFNSVRTPTGAFDIMPGLRAVGRAKVQCESPQTLLARLQLDAKAVNWLVIDMLGEECGVMEALRSEALRHLFSVVVVRAGDQALYEGSVGANELIEGLKQDGFVVQGCDLSDADLPRYCLTLDRVALENQALKQQLAEAQKAHGRELEALRKSVAEASKAHKAELEAKQNKARQELAQLEQQALAERDKMLAEAEEKHQAALAEAQRAHERELEALREGVAEANKAHEELAHLHKTSADKVQELDALSQQLAVANKKITELQEANHQLEQKTHALTSLESEAERLREEVEAAREELRQQKSDLGIALRLQALRENDLRELQQRYGQMSQVNEQQRELLGKLHQRLSVAAEYLAVSDDSDTGSDPVREELVRALTGEQTDQD